MGEEAEGEDGFAVVVKGGEEAVFVSAGIEHRHRAFAMHRHGIGGRVGFANVGETLPARRAGGLAPASQPCAGLRVAHRGLLQEDLFDDSYGYIMSSRLRLVKPRAWPRRPHVVFSTV